MKNCIRLISMACVIAASLSGSLMFSSCANIIPPSGGNRDSLPPVLVTSNPKDSAVNVKTKNIVLTFNEFVRLQDPSQQIIYSPVPKNTPSTDYKLRNITIRLRDSLEANTTYAIDFGNSIIDENEGNIARNFRYVFSTGPAIDFNTYQGKVLVAETGKTDSTLLVVLHKDLSDTAIQKNSPRFYTRVNGKGEFSFQNLPSGSFAAYVVNSKSYNRIFDSTELFAFRDSIVIIGSNNNPMDTFYAFVESPVKPKGSGDASQALPPSFRDDKRLRYLALLDNGMQDLLSNLPMVFNRKIFALDTTKMLLTDTSYNPLKGYSFHLDSARRTVTLSYPWKENTSYRLVLQKDAMADTNAVVLPKADTLVINTRKETEYGSLRFRFMNLDTAQRPVIQLVQNNEVVASYPILQNDFTIKRFKPGSYDVRILYDTNRNGKWDTGNFSHVKHQPERVFAIPRQLSIRANWDNEVTIGLE